MQGKLLKNIKKQIRMDNNSQVLENIVDMLCGCLNFYATEENYSNNVISKDNGFQAKSILGLVDTLRGEFNSIESDYNELLKEAVRFTENEEN
jgi:hypothetical protein